MGMVSARSWPEADWELVTPEWLIQSRAPAGTVWTDASAALYDFARDALPVEMPRVRLRPLPPRERAAQDRRALRDALLRL